MRKGYSLIEIIGMLALLVLALSLALKPTRMLISDVPRQNRDFQTAASCSHMLNSLKTDIEAAKELALAGEPNTLIIDSGISYHFENEQVCRIAGNDPNTTRLWTLPHSRWVWEIKNQNSLQITGWLERTVLGKTEKQFNNSHLFCVKGYKPGESQ